VRALGLDRRKRDPAPTLRDHFERPST
jgi:hypothetical protein